MKVIVCTKNKGKIKAVEEVITLLWPEVEIVSEKSESGVREQPLSEVEGIKGAINRINNLKDNHPEADYYIGLEGYVDSNEYGMFLGGVTVVMNKAGVVGIGTSGKMQLPKIIEARISKGEELGPIITDLMNDEKKEIPQNEGTNGILSNGLYTRIDEFKDATKCALARFQSPDILNKVI